jgi:hypothetical protein
MSNGQLRKMAPAVNAPRGWRRLPPPDLENLIVRIRRSATHRHLSAGEWRELDRMRAHYAALVKGAN